MPSAGLGHVWISEDMERVGRFSSSRNQKKLINKKGIGVYIEGVGKVEGLPYLVSINGH